MNTYKVCTCGTQTVTSFQSSRATPGGRLKIIIFRLDESLQVMSLFMLWFLNEFSMVVRWQRNCPQLGRLKRWKACNRQIETCSKRNRQTETCVTDRQIETPCGRDRQIETLEAKPFSQLGRLKRWKARDRQIETCEQTDRQIETPCGRDRQNETLEAKPFSQLGRLKRWTMYRTDTLDFLTWRQRLLLREPG